MSIGASTNVSTGRGGAGNIGSLKLKPTSDPKHDLSTPHLRSAIYTTGRGGSGNMAKFEVDESRKAQDVEPVARKHKPVGTTVMTGRGGGGNMHRIREDDEGNVVFEDENQLQKITSREGRTKERKGSFLDKAREELAKIRGSSGSKSRASRQGSAASSSASSVRSSR